MLFEKVLAEMRNGIIAYRTKWQPNVSIALQKGYPNGVAANDKTQELFNVGEDTRLKVDPYFQLYVAGEERLQNYNPTTEDILAADWEVLKV